MTQPLQSNEISPLKTRLHPKYWGAWIATGCLYLISQLPQHWQFKIGDGIGLIMKKVLPKRRYICDRNITTCFPQLTPTQQQQLTTDTFKSVGRGIVEFAMSCWFSPQRLAQLLTIEGEGYLAQAQNNKQGVLLLGAHHLSAEIVGRALGVSHPIHAVYREQNNLVFDALIKQKRARTGAGIIHRYDIRSIIKALRKLQIVWYAADQDYGAEHSIFAPFFSQPAATITAWRRLAKQTDAIILCANHHRQPNGHYILKLTPLVLTDNELNDATAFNRQLELSIKQHPEQYLWLHRRFKTTPNSEQSIYEI